VDERTADERLAVALIAALEQRERRLETELEECDLVSPLSGVVVMVRVAQGRAVQTRGGKAAVVLIDPADLIVRTAVPETLAKILGPGEDAWVEFDQPGLGGAASVLAVDDVSYAVPGMAGGFARDVLLTVEPGLLSGLSIGAEGRVALRR
jgi:multidrug resistance efflux pump